MKDKRKYKYVRIIHTIEIKNNFTIYVTKIIQPIIGIQNLVR